MCDKEKFIGAYSPCFHQHHEVGWGRGKARKKRLLGQSHGLTVAVFPVESKKCGKRKTGKDKVIKNKTQTSATRLSGTKLLTHHSLRMCFKLTTLQKTCNHYHRLALPKKNYHCSITYELSPTKVNEWLLLLNPQPLTAHLPQQLLQDCLLHKAWSS